MSQTKQLEEAIEKVARMDQAGVPVEQIAQAFNIPLDKLLGLQETPKYKEKLAELVAEAFEKSDVLNSSWDMVESLAMNKVVDHLQKVPDPDYALKAAALANKAVRRGRHTNEVLGVQPNQQAIIHVSLQFADKLQQNFEVTQQPVKSLKKKDDNFLAPKSVTKLLTTKTKTQEEQDLMDEIGDLGDFKPAYA